MRLLCAHILPLGSQLQPQGSFGLTSCQTEMFLQVNFVSWGCSNISYGWDPLQHCGFALQLSPVLWLGFFPLCQQGGAVSPSVPSLHPLPGWFLCSGLCRGVSAPGLCPHAQCPLEVTVTPFCWQRTELSHGGSLTCLFLLFGMWQRSSWVVVSVLSPVKQNHCSPFLKTLVWWSVWDHKFLCKTFTISLLSDFFFYSSLWQILMKLWTRSGWK